MEPPIKHFNFVMITNQNRNCKKSIKIKNITHFFKLCKILLIFIYQGFKGLLIASSVKGITYKILVIVETRFWLVYNVINKLLRFIWRMNGENVAKVCIIKCDSYDKEKVKDAVDFAFRELEIERLFKEGENILLKPNLLSSKTPDKAVTTHPEVFRGVALAMQNCKVNLSYGDSPAAESPSKAQRICGIEEVANELSIPEADFVTPINRDFPEGVLVRKFQLVKAAEDTDGIISICKFKTHALTRFTGAMKNQFGLIPGTLKAQDHVRFPDVTSFTQMLTDLNNCVKPRLYVMDAIVGMEGNGPANGTPRHMGMIIISDDPVAMDSVCVGLMGLDYKTILSVMTGAKCGLGIADHDKINLCLIEDAPKNNKETTSNVQGNAPSSIQRTVIWDVASKMIPLLALRDFQNAMDGGSALTFASTFLGPLVKKAILNRPVIVHENCTKCKLCVRVCPVKPKAIEFSNKKQKIVYHYSRCIRCFCCQELCPHAAIVVKKAPLHFLLGNKKKSK